MTFPPDSSSERRLTRAIEHVNKLWFPFNPTVLKQLEESFASKDLEKTSDAIITILKQDFALYSYVIKELILIAMKAGLSASIIFNPVELLQWASHKQIKDILFTDKALPATHTLHMSEDFQIQRLSETAIIASTAEVLSKSKNLNPELGFCRGLLREIGLNLIAWNYPLLYARIIKDITPDSTLEQQLTKELGFSPTMLAMRIITPYDIKDESPEGLHLREEWNTYESLCQVGEALAHADNPKLYPTAEKDWLVARDYISQHAGTAGLRTIQDAALQNTKKYSSALPISFQGVSHINPEKKISEYKQAIRVYNNRYVRFCRPELQKAIHSLYADMPTDSVNLAVLEKLIKKVIPAAGFTGGCIFVIDPAALTLSPSTIIGKVKGRSLSKITLHTHAISGLGLGLSETELIEAASEHDDAIANAFACLQPIIEHAERREQEALTTISSSLGDRRRIGVLYLEKPTGASREQDSLTLTNFKALRQALCDALHLD